MNGNLVIVTGYFGAPLKQTASDIADRRSLPLVDLDKEIESSDGRTIRKMVMSFGEHQYRNKEYELLKKLTEQNQPAVVLCGDGVLHDDDSREIILQNELVIVGNDLSPDELWEKARSIRRSYHAFMNFGTDDEKRAAFERLIERQRELFKDYM